MSVISDLSSVEWVKSSYSGNGGGSCVEWAPSLASAGIVPVRDSKDPHGPALAFPVSSWASFISAVKGGQLPAS
ncbi:DUF397 domain-containing protein [Streptomyces iranensis]|uniref:DUF397 domain-containing protein n=1 Tax=Streptomyces iranensis TaxID=576784 RepID=UPI0039B7535C